MGLGAQHSWKGLGIINYGAVQSDTAPVCTDPDRQLLGLKPLEKIFNFLNVFMNVIAAIDKLQRLKKSVLRNNYLAVRGETRPVYTDSHWLLPGVNPTKDF